MRANVPRSRVGYQLGHVLPGREGECTCLRQLLASKQVGVLSKGTSGFPASAEDRVLPLFLVFLWARVRFPWTQRLGAVGHVNLTYSRREGVSHDSSPLADLLVWAFMAYSGI